jgi:integrase
MNATRILDGRREGELLAFPSVRRMADILSQRCREPSWVRTSVATLERFRAMTGRHDLEMLLDQALAEPAIAEQALVSFASALAGYTESQVSALAMGAKIWFRLNGVAVSWRPLPGISSPPSLAASDQQGVDRLILLSLIGSGLRLAELLRLRLGNVGSLDSEGRLIPDIESDPLAVQHIPRRGKQRERITFLTYHARQALLASLEARIAPGQPIDLNSPLIAQRNGSNVTGSSVARARQRSQSLIRAGSNVNVELCRTTGDFFRDWGLPGSRFVGPEELNIEEYI